MLLKPQHGCSNEPFLVRLALSQHRRELASELGRDANVLQDLAELTDQRFFAHVRVTVFPVSPTA